jgi:uncharacterized protein (DUF2126 family)/transglutaminase-like putative cysteine protease
MAIEVGLTHRTSYAYDRAARLGPQVIRLRPAAHARTRILSYGLTIEPARHFLNWQQDPHGNWLARVVIPEPATRFAVVVDLVAEISVVNPFDFFLEPGAETWPFAYEPLLRKDLAPYLEPEPVGPRLAAWLGRVDRTPTRTADFLVSLNRRLQGDIGYVIRMEPGIQKCEETLGLGTGSCRDSAWLLVQLLRNLGLAARFTSGYLIQLKPDVVALDGPAGTDRDFTDLHAWAEVYLPGAGWIGLDPTSGLLAGEGHIPLACTPDPQNAAPITGEVEPCGVSFDFAMRIERIRETPRVTKPYEESVWQAILACGDAVDARLVAGDVRLTTGGEPTFVSLDDVDGEEWNTAAVGPTKRQLADVLIRRLRDRFAPGGLLHYGQGKWYPGESLPRWAFALYWRADGDPLWADASLISRERPDRTASIADAERFAHRLADHLGVDAGYVVPAYEDPATYLLKEHGLPINIEPGDPRLDDPEERARLARVFDRGLGAPAGFVLPLQRWQARAGGGWMSERWGLRRERLVLSPGDSPLGFRLPLGSLPWLPAADYPYVIPADPFAAHAALPPSPTRAQDRQRERAQPERPRAPRDGPVPEPPPGIGATAVRTALAVEPRDGHLCVFLPPLAAAEDLVDLVGAIEHTAADLDQPVHLEGYPAPPDARVHCIKVTPDPGVIEVNVQPARSWRAAVAITEGLYEDARLSRLGTDKFLLDGRHTGTGGGNHIVVGGASAPDSPFLRRPDLLASLVTYWQHHPALSYLFSGLFIGPTSQAPRIDEARHDALYELEIAIRQLPPRGADCPPWLVDRVFRNLLVDVSGNTHRAEICIDKLYAPEGPTGRLGLVEFRAFEMPPHPRMSLAQQLLLRALIARFWDEPYTGTLVRWGTRLHDAFMLPHVVWTDLCAVLDEMNRAGFGLDPAWFQPHLEFRFPLYGAVEVDGVMIELRQALEPWHVLGEEGALGGTVRYVDSSVERLQVRVEALAPERHDVACNGVAIPLTPTGRPGEAVAGVRFRAWQPASCLHPTIGVHSPLVFDLHDRWSGRSLGGCTYHVMHPGGRNYDTFPVNAFEAEARRLARFERIGHTPGPSTVRRPAPDPEFPYTLDLRRM